MRARLDRAADAVYLNLTYRPIKDSAAVADRIVVDYDDEGRIVGIEFSMRLVPRRTPRRSNSSVSKYRHKTSTGSYYLAAQSFQPCSTAGRNAGR
jgi:uncharacterized protein YuzE